MKLAELKALVGKEVLYMDGSRDVGFTKKICVLESVINKEITTSLGVTNETRAIITVETPGFHHEVSVDKLFSLVDTGKVDTKIEKINLAVASINEEETKDSVTVDVRIP